MNRLYVAALGVWTCVCVTATAADFARVESGYLGDGWFKYRVTLASDAFFDTASIGAIAVDFTNRVSFGTNPPAWTPVTSEDHSAIWNADPQLIQARPYEATFLVRSSNTTFKTVEAGVMLSYAAEPQAALVSTAFTASAGFGKLRAIVPCPPTEADGSASTLTTVMSLRGDLTISSLTIANGAFSGLSFDWATDSTVRLETSTNLVNWTAVTNLVGDAGATVWTASAPLAGPDRFYRLKLLATEKTP